MNRTTKHLMFGLSAGVTVFAIVVPLIHLLAELLTFLGLELSTWDNPVQIFIFVVTAAVVGVFPWGLWILLTDARVGDMFDEGHEVAAYFVAALLSFLVLTLLSCTRAQSIYAEYRWLLSPVLIVCAVALIWWRWRRVWRMPRPTGIGGALRAALAL